MTNSGSDGGGKRIRWIGALSAIAALLFLPYTLTKGTLTTIIRNEGWQLAGASPESTEQLLHLLEALPIAAMVAGLFALRVRTDVRSAASEGATLVVVAGLVLTIVTHVGEHLLQPLTVAAVTGDANWFLWGYYLSWLVMFVGLTLYGLTLIARPGIPGWLPGVLIGALPAAVTVGLGVVALDVFTMAGTFRVALALAWITIGLWLWADPASSGARREGALGNLESHD